MSRPPSAVLLALFASLILASPAAAYVFLGSSWPSGQIPLQLQLDATAPTSVALPLNDGATSWNALAQAAANDWNTGLVRSRFTTTTSSATTARYGDGTSSVVFSSSIYGSAFPSRTLAVTLVVPLDDDSDEVRSVEADVLVNRAITWNSYRGTIRNTPIDLRRVLLHEFGHVLGLDHPDQATPAQAIASIMNSTVDSNEILQADDLLGITHLYGKPIPAPIITTQPADRTVKAGNSTTLDVAVDGRDPPVADDFHSYRWFYRAKGATTYEVLFTLHNPGSLPFALAQPIDSGTYYFRAVTPDHTVESRRVTLEVLPIATEPVTALANLSTRGLAGSGSTSMIVGFVVTGPRPKRVLVRAVGPTLGAAPFSVPGTLAEPQLTLRTAAGATVATSLATWDAGADAAAIRETSARVGAFALAPGAKDAVLLVDLAPGNYTAVAAGPTGTNGVVMVEAYDADLVPDPASRLVNLSSRGYVSTGSDILIAGFVVRGPGPRNYLLRVAGDTLRQLGLTGTLDDPYLKLFRQDGALVRELDDWDSPAAAQPTLRAAFTQVGAFALADRQEPAMLLTLPPGTYTAQVNGLTNGGSSNPRGIALIEIYELP